MRKAEYNVLPFIAVLIEILICLQLVLVMN